MRTSKVPFRVGWFCICCTSLSLSANSAMAAFSGNPVGGPDATPGVAMDSNGVGWWKSTLNPSPALQMSTCPWVLSGLSAQGFDADGADNMPGGGDDWTVTTATALTGSVKINEYYAWVTQQPSVTLAGPTNWGGQGPFSFFGGAWFQAEYQPQGADPTTIRWMQAIRTNAPSTHGTTNGFNAGSGYYEYLDNAGTSGTDPFHPSLPNGAATNTLFYDGPARSVAPPPKSVSWQAQTFVSTWNSAARTITIYEDGIWWGFDLVSAIPEPSAMALIGLAMTAMRLRRKAMC